MEKFTEKQLEKQLEDFKNITITIKISGFEYRCKASFLHSLQSQIKTADKFNTTRTIRFLAFLDKVIQAIQNKILQKPNWVNENHGK
jgi:hypothetical protein